MISLTHNWSGRTLREIREDYMMSLSGAKSLIPNVGLPLLREEYSLVVRIEWCFFIWADETVIIC